jgi:hypothetical protein
MDIGGEGASVYAEAKSEYTKQLCQYLVPSLQQYFLDMLEDAKQKEPEPRKILVAFQSRLELIAEWNMDKVQRETTTLAMSTHCDYLDELLRAVFIAHTKVLSAIRLTTKQKKIQITIPKLDHFLHRTMTECARILWSNTYMFSTTAPSIERQKNLRLIEGLLYDGVLQSIRGMLPVKNILREYLNTDDEEGEDSAEEEVEGDEPVSEEAAYTSQEDEKDDALIHIMAPDVSGNTVEELASPIPTFTGIDTAFEEESSNAVTTVEDAAEDAASSDAEDEPPIQIMDLPPEPMTDFEDLNQPAESLGDAVTAIEDEFLPIEAEEFV